MKKRKMKISAGGNVPHQYLEPMRKINTFLEVLEMEGSGQDVVRSFFEMINIVYHCKKFVLITSRTQSFKY